MNKRFYDITELAEYLGVKTNTLYGWIHQRKIPYVKVGRLVRFDIEKIDEWVASRAQDVYIGH